MTDKEYKKVKSLQKKLLSNLEAVKLSNQTMEMFDLIIDKTQKANAIFSQAEKALQKLINEIGKKDYTA